LIDVVKVDKFPMVIGEKEKKLLCRAKKKNVTGGG
jgi:hypothetical protein